MEDRKLPEDHTNGIDYSPEAVRERREGRTVLKHGTAMRSIPLREEDREEHPSPAARQFAFDMEQLETGFSTSLNRAMEKLGPRFVLGRVASVLEQRADLLADIDPDDLDAIVTLLNRVSYHGR